MNNRVLFHGMRVLCSFNCFNHALTLDRVSSVLNRDVKQFGKKFMFDGNEETCWNSDQGSPQSVLIELPGAASVESLEIQFQGGFASREGGLWAGNDLTALKEIHKFYPSDDNSLQVN